MLDGVFERSACSDPLRVFLEAKWKEIFLVFNNVTIILLKNIQNIADSRKAIELVCCITIIFR